MLNGYRQRYSLHKSGRRVSRHCKDVKTISDISNYDLERPLPTRGNQKVIGFMKDGLGRKIMIELAALRPKINSYLTDYNDKGIKTQSTKKYVIKEKLQLKDYKNCLEATQPENKVNQLQKNKVDVDSLGENHKEFIKINMVILELLGRLRNQKRNVFTE